MLISHLKNRRSNWETELLFLSLHLWCISFLFSSTPFMSLSSIWFYLILFLFLSFFKSLIWPTGVPFLFSLIIPLFYRFLQYYFEFFTQSKNRKQKNTNFHQCMENHLNFTWKKVQSFSLFAKIQNIWIDKSYNLTLILFLSSFFSSIFVKKECSIL